MRLTMAFRAALLAALILSANLLMATDRPRPYIVPTEPLSPREEHAALHVPPGFRVQLFASEPEIQKPINMAFDAAGRLWVTGSTEYPFAAPADRPGRDSIKILEDRDGDGRADRVTTFATGLNIPIGIYPYDRGAIVFSIPNIYDLKDTDGDGRADTRTVLYGPFDCGHDTHGLQNAFRRRLDGSIHACHGFANQSVVSGRDGHTIRMNSGNTYRFRMDGQRIEHFTWGQVNPFGLTMDRWGDWYTSDCHSKPQAMLVRGGYYPSFGAPHDGLGFVPPLMQHSHGSTAIDGAVCYSATQFPTEYYENLFCGNVVTSRVNRDVLVRHGSSLHAETRNDFLISDDGWFRPVDLQVGPDGALYIADFYNRIIGHYEVPLDHPGRDRHRGRIWRVTYTGAGAKAAGAKAAGAKAAGATDIERPSAGDLSRASVDALLEALADPNLGVRMRATDQLSDRVGLAAVAPTERAIHESRSPTVRVHGLWVLHRLNRLSEAAIQRAAGDREELVRLHAMRMLTERADWTTPLRQVALVGLSDRAVRVRRVAAEAVGLHADPSHIGPLVALIRAEEKEDSPLKHAARIALRNQFRDAAPIDQVWDNGLTFQDARVIADVAVGLPSEASATFLLD
ncbi:MAG: PVC-type heme-binding CxxCH protein, partial [Pirellulales bacterium]